MSVKVNLKCKLPMKVLLCAIIFVGLLFESKMVNAIGFDGGQDQSVNGQRPKRILSVRCIYVRLHLHLFPIV